MSKKLSTPVTENTVSEIDALTQASHIMINGHAMSITWAGDNTLHIRPDDFDEAVERPYNFGNAQKNLCTAMPKAWLDYANGKYPVAINGLHLRYTWEEMKRNPMGIVPGAGYLLAGRELPAEWAARLLSAPRQDTGVFLLDYVEGKLKIVKEMHDSTYVEGEYDGFGGPAQQRNAFNKHMALNMLLTGAAINVHYFPTTAERYVTKIMAPINQPIGERIEIASQAIGEYVVRHSEKGVAAYAAKLAGEGKTFQSAMRAVRMSDGALMSITEIVGHTFARKLGKVQLPAMEVTEINAENFVSVCAKNGLIVDLIS
jgi:hypothetical protein